MHVYSMQRDGRLPAQLRMAGQVIFEKLPAATAPVRGLLGQLGHFGTCLAQRWADERRPPDVVHAESWRQPRQPILAASPT